MELKEKLSRLAIFVFYDPQGTVDRYVTYLLEALRPNVTRLVVVSNTELDNSNRERLERCCDDLFVRENRGLDAAAFKQGLVSFCGWEEVRKYDEVVLLNDTFFGPITSFDAVFSDMASRAVDFWGMAAGYSTENTERKVKYGFVPEHIQSYFIVFRQSMVQSQAFYDYWQGYDDSMNTYLDVVTEHELVMTKHFQDLGFRWDIYANTERYHSKFKSENFNLYLYHSYRMMKDMRFPAFKKKVLNLNIAEYLFMTDLEEPAMAMDYIRDCTDYDSNLIWDDVIRIYNPADLYNSLHLNFVLPSCTKKTECLGQAALVYHIANPFFAEELCRHAERLARTLDVFILPEGKAVEKAVRENLPADSGITLLKPTEQDTEMGGLVLGCRELSKRYSYLGYLHDVQNPDHSPMAACESTVFGYLQNIANDGSYVSQVLHCFERNPRLGVLGTPFPIHNHGFGNYGNEWGNWYPSVKSLSEKLGLRCTLEEKKPPVMLTGAFWCRTAALEPLWKENWQPRQFHRDPFTQTSQLSEALKRILPFVSQSESYYSGIVMHTNYASMRITSQQYMLDKLVPLIRQQDGCYSEHFNGFCQQLQAFGTVQTAQRTPAGFRTRFRVFLERHMPRRIVNAIVGIYHFFQNR